MLGWVVVAGEGPAVAPCNSPISHYTLQASSSYQHIVGPQHGHLRNEAGGGAWCPKTLIKHGSVGDEYLEVVLEGEYTVHAVITQGRFGNGLGQEFAEHVIIQYWRPGYTNYRRYTNEKGEHVLQANRDTDTEVELIMDTPFVASKVRILPFSYHARTVCIRVGLKGCKYTGKSPKTTQRSVEKACMMNTCIMYMYYVVCTLGAFWPYL